MKKKEKQKKGKKLDFGFTKEPDFFKPCLFDYSDSIVSNIQTLYFVLLQHFFFFFFIGDISFDLYQLLYYIDLALKPNQSFKKFEINETREREKETKQVTIPSPSMSERKSVGSAI